MERRLSDFFTDEIAKKARFVKKVCFSEATDPVVTGLEYDSRKITRDSVYFALPGVHADGHTYIDAAIANGAAVIVHQNKLEHYRRGVCYLQVKDSRFAMSPLAAAFYKHPSRHLAVIGVTGTEGKSTTVYLIYQLLTLLGKKAGFISTVQYGDGNTVHWNPEHQTTPEAPTIHRLLEEIRGNGAEYAVLEASSHGLSLKTNRLGDVAFDAGVLTNINHEHLEFHGTWEQYRDDKANLFRALDADSFGHDKFSHYTGDLQNVPCFGVINADDDNKNMPYIRALTKHKIYTYSVRGRDADISLKTIHSHPHGNWYAVLIRETLTVKDIRDLLPGSYNAGNVMACLLTVSVLLSEPIENLIAYIPYLKPVRGRMTRITKGQPFEVLVDYAHTPSSFETILPPLKERMENGRKGRIITLFGSAGERDRQKRSEQGRIAAEYSDIVVLTDEDPRSEVPMDILEEIAKGITGKKRDKTLFLIPDRPLAIRKAFSLARPNDLVLLLGKGHENSIIYADKVVPFDEISEAQKALSELGWIQGHELLEREAPTGVSSPLMLDC